MKLSLSLHVYSPRIEMFSQMGFERNLPCPTTIDIAGKIICSVEEISSTIDNAIVRLLREREECLSKLFYLQFFFISVLLSGK